MAAVFFRSHDPDPAHDPPARLIGVKEKRGKALALVVRRARDEDKMLRLAGPGDEPFTSENAPAAGSLFGARIHQRRIGARSAIGLGHGKRRTDAAVDDRREPAFLLRRRRDLREYGHVAVVGCGTVERDRAEYRAAHFFVEYGDFRNGAAEAAVGDRNLRRPKPAPFDQFAQRGEVLEVDILVLVIGARIVFERDDAFVDERAHGSALCLERRRGMEIHGPRGSP